MFKSFSHVNIRTADLARSKQLFVDVLGLTDGFRPPMPDPGAWLYWEDRAIVHLVELDEPATPSIDTSLDHFSFYVEDFEETRGRLEACGIAYTELSLPKLGLYAFAICDASGVQIELSYRGQPVA